MDTVPIETCFVQFDINYAFLIVYDAVLYLEVRLHDVWIKIFFNYV